MNWRSKVVPAVVASAVSAIVQGAKEFSRKTAYEARRDDRRRNRRFHPATMCLKWLNPSARRMF